MNKMQVYLHSDFENYITESGPHTKCFFIPIAIGKKRFLRKSEMIP